MKKHNSTLKITSLIIIFFVLLSSCSSFTLIDSNPPGANLYINGNFVGKTPHNYSDKKIVGSIISVRMEKEGYEPLLGYFVRDQKFDAGLFALSFITYGIPLLWVMKYHPVQYFELKPIETQTKN